MDATLLSERLVPQSAARPPVVARLPRTRALRVRTAIVLLVAGPLALGTCFALLAMVVGAPTPASKAFGAVVGTASTVAALWWIGSRLRLASCAGRVEIDDEHIRVEDRALLRDPIVIHRSQLAGAAVGAPDPPLGWVPVLADPDQTPNLTLVFNEPIPAPRLRRRGEHLPPPGAALTALAVGVDDPVAVADALDRWNVGGPLAPDDARLHIASARHGSLRHALLSRSERRGWILVAAGLVIPVLGLAAITDAAAIHEHRPRRAVALALAGITVFAVRVGLAVAMGWGSAACGA